jgi:hypothetical protein
LVAGCGDAAGKIGATSATESSPAVSPSGKYRLVIVSGDEPDCGPFTQFEVLSTGAGHRTLFTSPDRFRKRDRTYYLWDDQDRVWAYSGDIGMSYAAADPEGRWLLHSFGSGAHPPVPPALNAVPPLPEPR